MTLSANDIIDGVVLTGSQFSEPMRVIGSPAAGDRFVMVNLVGTRTNTFRGGVTLSNQDLPSMQIERIRGIQGVDMPERIAYLLSSAAALQIHLLPAPHAERPGRGYFFPDTEVTHAN